MLPKSFGSFALGRVEVNIVQSNFESRVPKTGHKKFCGTEIFSDIVLKYRLSTHL